MKAMQNNPVDPATDRPRFGGVLNRLRESRLLTIEALAENAEMSVGSISNYEHGIQTPRQTALARLADALDVPFELLHWFAYAQPRRGGPALSSFAAIDKLMRTELELCEKGGPPR